jgi:broad specificity phosphatase PhoE
MEPLPDALERARAATAAALAAGERTVVVGHQGILRIVLIALGRLAPQDYFSLRLHEAEPVIVEDPVVVAP